MSYPATPAILSDPESINVIMEAEVSILQCMADLFCNTLVTDIQSLVSIPASPTIDELDAQVALLKTIMCGYTAKESSIASVVAALAKKSAVDLGVDPGVITCCTNGSCGSKS